MLFFDTETCGYYGPICLLQWAVDAGDINLYCPFTNTVETTLNLFDKIINHKEGICGFNLNFDWFHICQMYNTLLMYEDKTDYPINDIYKYAIYEEKSRHFAKCIKPYKPIDLMTYARKGEYQSMMNRNDIKIKKVPTSLAYLLVDKLNTGIKIKDIFFSGKTKGWKIEDCEDLDFKNIVLRFSPSSSLKAITKDALKISVTTFSEVELSDKFKPNELGFAPYALAIKKNNYTNVINYHIDHWETNSLAREYARNDVKYTRDLYHYFGEPKSDTDSVLSCMVATLRWKGYAVNEEKILGMKEKSVDKYCKITGWNGTFHEIFNPNAPNSCKSYLHSKLNETEKIFASSTKSEVLESISNWTVDKVCECGGLDDNCFLCEGSGLLFGGDIHPAAKIAKAILTARHTKKEIELYDKLLLTKRLHASLNVVGTLSSRMSGRDGLNVQGINRDKEIRELFPLADDDKVLCGGDFDGFEVSIADAIYRDPALHKELLSGKKIHALLGEKLFAPMSYEEIIQDKDKYARSKAGVFALLYGGQGYTLSNRVGISEEKAEKAYEEWCDKYKIWGLERKKIFNKFCSMTQPNGIGTKVIWKDPDDYIESLFGFKRYFTIENKITKYLFNLAENPPKSWEGYKDKIVRRDREQTELGALRSSLFATAFQIQASNMRAAGNHVIQSTGAQITKELQKSIWDLQPQGVQDYLVMPLNIHDEIMCVADKGIVDKLSKCVKDFISENKKVVPLLSMTWKTNLNTWGDK